ELGRATLPVPEARAGDCGHGDVGSRSHGAGVRRAVESARLMPRANFSCRPCTLAGGNAVEVIHEDLPVESKACPLTGKRRGFTRLFDGVMVSTKGHRIAKILDPIMTPHMDQASANKTAVANSEAQIAAMSKQIEAMSREIKGLTEQQRGQVA